MTAKGSLVARKRMARLLAVQAVYQSIHNNHAPSQLFDEFVTYRNGVDDEGDKMVEADRALFRDILTGVTERWGDIQDMLTPRLQSRAIVEPLLTAIMVCGAYEIIGHPAIDAPIIINDYMEITTSFYEGTESKLVNAVLDGLAKEVRR